MLMNSSMTVQSSEKRERVLQRNRVLKHVTNKGKEREIKRREENLIIAGMRLENLGA